MAQDSVQTNRDHEQPIGPDDPVSPLPANAELVVQTSSFYQSLPAEAQQALMSSPTLINQLATFLLTGGAIRFEDLGSGAAGTFQAAAGDQGAVIRLDDSILASLNGVTPIVLKAFSEQSRMSSAMP